LKKSLPRKSAIYSLLFFCSCSWADEGIAYYMANEGVMVSHGDTKIAFDPIFRNGFGQYLLLPAEMESALFAGEPPFDGLDAVFISHYHGDHFSAEDLLRLMEAHPQLQLFAPAQAVLEIRAVNDVANIMNRVNQVALEYQDAPVSLGIDGIDVEAVRIPHSGWPDSRAEVENIAWRVTLDEAATVLHLGDADARDVHFAIDAEFWQRNQPDTAFPPYWFFGSRAGREILQNRIGADSNVGVHVPVTIPADPVQRPQELRSADLFTRPTETRSIGH